MLVNSTIFFLYCNAYDDFIRFCSVNKINSTSIPEINVKFLSLAKAKRDPL